MGAEEPTLTVSLELTIGSDPISGRLIGGDGTERAFVGWLALVRALEEVTATFKERREA